MGAQRAGVLVAEWGRGLLGHPASKPLVTLGAALVTLVIVYLQVRATSAGISSADLYAYYDAALAVRERRDPFVPVATWIASYHPGETLVATYYVYTPFFAALLIPLTFVPVDVAYVLWSLCNLLFLVGAVYAALRVCGVYPSAMHVAILSAAAALWNSTRLELQWGQADLLVLFCVAVSLWAALEKRPILAGALLAVACLTKPFLLCFVVALLWKREYRYALVSAGAFLVGLIAPFIWIGVDSWRDQLTVWSFWSNQYVPFIDNQAPKGVFARLFTVNPNTTPLVNAPWLMTALWLIVAALVVGIVAASVSRRRLVSDDRTLVELSLIITAMLLISPLTEYIYIVILILPFVLLTTVLWRHGWQEPHTRPMWLCLALIWLLLVFPLKNIEYFFWPRMASASGPLLVAYVWLAVPYLYVIIGLFALELWLLRLVTGQTLRDALKALPGDIWADWRNAGWRNRLAARDASV